MTMDIGFSDKFLQTLGWQKYSHEVFFLITIAFRTCLTVMVAIWSDHVGFIWSLPEGVREIWYHRFEYVTLF